MAWYFISSRYSGVNFSCRDRKGHYVWELGCYLLLFMKKKQSSLNQRRLDFDTILFLPCLLQLIGQPCNILHQPSPSPLLKRQHLGGKKRIIVDDLAISTAENRTGDLTFYFRDLFFGLFLHHLLLELDLGHLGHLLSLCQKHRFLTAGGRSWDWTNAHVLQSKKADLPMIARFLSVSASFSTILWVWVVISRRVFSASLYAGHKTSDTVSPLSPCSHLISHLQEQCHKKVYFHTYMSSKFLLIDSGIFGFVTRTAFIGGLMPQKVKKMQISLRDALSQVNGSEMWLRLWL